MRWLFFTCALVAGCGGTGAMPADMAQPAPDMTSTLCMDSRSDAWALPLTKTSANGLFKVTLTAGDPDPITIGINTWTLAVTDANDAPMSGMVFTSNCHGVTTTACPWMPDHGHGTSVKAQITPAATAGSYTVTPLYLFMAGLWQVTFTLQAPGATTSDTVVFSYCLADLTGM